MILLYHTLRVVVTEFIAILAVASKINYSLLAMINNENKLSHNDHCIRQYVAIGS